MPSDYDLRTNVLTELSSGGSDTSRPHNFDFYLYFPTEVVANEVAQRLMRQDYRVEFRPAFRRTDWLCLVKLTIIPDAAPLTEIETLFTQLAQEFHGKLHGWESHFHK